MALKLGLLGLLFCAFFVAVWSGGRSPVPVSGKVTYNGKPLANVNVICVGKGNDIATGTTDEQGSFRSLTTHSPEDGAFPGNYSVAIAPGSPPPGDSYAVPPLPSFPARYLSSDTSPLRISVTTKGENRFHLNLTD